MGNRHVHRADLHRGLLDAATDLGCRVRLNSRVVNIDPSLPALATHDGKLYSADLIVASDGDYSSYWVFQLSNLTLEI